MAAVSPQSCVEQLWLDAGNESAALAALELTGTDPALPSSFAIGTAAQSTIAVSALAAAELLVARGEPRQAVAVDLRAAAVEFRGEQYLRVDNGPALEFRDRISGLFRCGDGRWVRIHANFPHHRDGVLALLDCRHDRAEVELALRSWQAERFEEAAAERGLVVTALRTFAEWDVHPQGRAVAALPLMTIERIGASSRRPLRGERPLAGVRVLDLTRVIAGPVCGRTLAGHGAEVLLVSATHLPSIEPLVIETGLGKLSCFLDLREPSDRRSFLDLLREADVLVQSYRPGGLAALGLGPEEAASQRPGIIYASLSTYGPVGPWAERRGYDSLVQTATGFNAAEAEAAGTDTPKPLPTQALDRATGYLLAFAVMVALKRRAIEGGSWHIRCSLAQTARWLRNLGRVEQGFGIADPTLDDVRDLTASVPSGFGQLTIVRHAARLERTPFRWDRPSVPLGTHPPRWP